VRDSPGKKRPSDMSGDKLTGDGCQIVGENGLKATLFVLIVQHHNRSHVQRLFCSCGQMVSSPCKSCKNPSVKR
jgi:hypothetical protein